MALSARQITLSASTITALLVLGDGTGTTFKTITGHLQDPVPVTIKNEDAAAIVWVGGPDVSATKGQSVGPGASKTINVYSNDFPFAFSTGTPVISVLCGRQ